jgi:6-phosphogluconolactonase (cycloisomerase 2 family)
MVAHTILVGSYTNDISTLVFTPGSTPSLKLVDSIKVGHHPSWITRHAAATTQGKTVVFTGIEQTEGTIVALEFDRDGKGTVVSQTSAGGRDPCTLEVTSDGKELLVGNVSLHHCSPTDSWLTLDQYSSGYTVTIPLTTSSPYLPKAKTDSLPTVATTGTGPKADRQEASHPHHVYFSSPAETELLVPDLGADKTWRLTRDDHGNWKNTAAIEYIPGGGPRHVLVNGGSQLLRSSSLPCLLTSARRWNPLHRPGVIIGALCSYSSTFAGRC